MSDGRLRELERAARSGDPQAVVATARELERAGRCPKHPGAPTTGVKRRRCSACVAERRAANVRERAVRELTKTVCWARSSRQVSPEGDFNNTGCWFPTDVEDAGGDVTDQARTPSRRWPYRYMKRARSRAHCRTLVERALAGHRVPHDVAMAVRSYTAVQGWTALYQIGLVRYRSPAGSVHLIVPQNLTTFCSRQIGRVGDPVEGEVTCKTCLWAHKSRDPGLG